MRAPPWTVWVCACILSTASTVPASSGETVIEVARFDNGVRTAQGGLFRCIGALPNHLSDRLVTVGEPASGAWQIAVAADAPPEGVGGEVPLFDDASKAKGLRLLDVSRTPHLHARLNGELDRRCLRVELIPGTDDPPVVLGTLSNTDLDASTWCVKTWDIPSEGLDRSGARAIRFLLEGDGRAWLALESLWFSSDASGASARPIVKPAERRPIRRAMWVWKTKEILPDPGRVERLLAFCKRYRITDLFCQVLLRRSVHGELELALETEQRTFITAAHRAGIKIHALDGDPNFVLRKNHARTFELVEALDRFNRAGPPEGRYDAIHMDNEPYILKEWKKDAEARQAVIRDYVELNRELRRRANAAGMEYGVDIPFWWDKVDESGQREFHLETDHGPVPLLEALFPLVQNAGIMSYRVRATGSNGVVGCCLTEFELGARFGVDVMASIETAVGPKVEEGITFGVHSPEYLLQQLDTLDRVLADQRGCIGLAIHYYKSFEEMLEQEP